MCASLVEMGKHIFSGQFQWLGCFSSERPPWRNRLARSAVNRKVGGSSPPGGATHFVDPPFSVTLRHSDRDNTPDAWPG